MSKTSKEPQAQAGETETTAATATRPALFSPRPAESGDDSMDAAVAAAKAAIPQGTDEQAALADIKSELLEDDVSDELHDVRLASELTKEMLDESEDEAPSVAELRALGERAVEATKTVDARERARRARDQGKKALEVRYAGAIGRRRNVVINEVPIGYQFLRFFAGIENSLYVLYKMGDMYMPVLELAPIKAAIEEGIKKMEMAAISADLSASSQLRLHEGANEAKPTYAKPTVDMEVFVRTRQADKFLDVIQKFDEVLGKLQAITWFGELDDSEIRTQQDIFRQEMRKAGMLCALTAKGLRTRAEQGHLLALAQGMVEAPAQGA